MVLLHGAIVTCIVNSVIVSQTYYQSHVLGYNIVRFGSVLHTHFEDEKLGNFFFFIYLFIFITKKH